MNKDLKKGSGVKSEISPADGKPKLANVLLLIIKIKNMFWKRKTKVANSNIGQVLLTRNLPLHKKEFKTMFEILHDAEKYDNANEIDVRNKTLQNLVDYINDFRSKNIS